MSDIWVKRSLVILSGGVCALYFPERVRIWILLILLVYGLRLWFWKPKDFFGRIFKPEIILLAAGIISGFVYALTGTSGLPEPLSLKQAEVSGILEDWRDTGQGYSGIVKIENIDPADTTDERILAEVQSLTGRRFTIKTYPDQEGNYPYGWELLQPGDSIKFDARLDIPKSSGTEGGFDLRLYNSVRNIAGNLITRGEAVILSAGNPSLIWRFKQHIENKMSFGDPVQVGIFEGILFGDTSRIPQDVLERYRITGVLHVFAASGSNVAFVLALFWGLTRFFPSMLRIGVCILVIMIYAVLCGGNAPILRAAIIGTAALLGHSGGRRLASLRWLLFAAVGLFIHNPWVLKDVGFQLSFAAAWGIIVLVPKLEQWKSLQKLPKSIRSLITVTLAAQLATLPVLITFFNRLSVIGLFANLIILFIIGSILELGLIGVLFSYSVLAYPLFQAGLWLIGVTDRVLALLADLPWAEVLVVYPGPLLWLIWYGMLGIWLKGWQRPYFVLRVQLRRIYRSALRLGPGSDLNSEKDKDTDLDLDSNSNSNSDTRKRIVLRLKPIEFLKQKKLLKWLAIPVLVFLIFKPLNAKELAVTMIDVGQGDSLLIQTPKNQTILVDTGPRTAGFDSGERIIVPYLLRQGIGSLDGLIITHADLDHIGGASKILSSLPAAWIGVPDVGEEFSNSDWQEGLPQTQAVQAKIHRLSAGDYLDLDSGVRLEILAPSEILSGTRSDTNNNCLVFKLTYLGQSFLFTGDMEVEEMEEIADLGEDWQTDIFKEPHHGSKYSLDEAWLDQIHPQAVLISVGRNSFGHPAPEILNYWQERGIPIYRTDEVGTITLHYSKNGIALETGRSR